MGKGVKQGRVAATLPCNTLCYTVTFVAKTKIKTRKKPTLKFCANMYNKTLQTITLYYITLPQPYNPTLTLQPQIAATPLQNNQNCKYTGNSGKKHWQNYKKIWQKQICNGANPMLCLHCS